MAVIRRLNVLGQERIDVPMLRSIEESVSGDLDVLAGSILAGGRPWVARGFDVVSVGVSRATALALRTAGGVLLHPTASEAGTVFNVPDDRADEVLAPTNARVSGAFAPSSVNFIGLDLTRQPDDATSDVVAFLDETTGEEEQREVPTAITLDYKIVISTLDFSATPGLAPVAKITTDAAGNWTTIVDSRSLFFRLAAPYGWPAGRLDSTDFTPAGDKVIADFPTWASAMMTRVWETGGGERWYAPTADRNVLVIGQGAVFTNGQYFEWDGTHVHWKNLTILFDNSTGRYNDVLGQTTDSVGLTNLADGECVYVDLDRTANRTGGTALQPVKAPIAALGAPSTPGARWVLVWRNGANVFTRDQTAPVGQANTPPATTSLNGAVRVSATPPVPGAPVAVLADASTRAVATGLTRAGAGGPGSGAVTVGGTTTDTSVVLGHAASTGTQVVAAGSTNGVLQVQNQTDLAGAADTVAAKVTQKSGVSNLDVFKVMGMGGLRMALALGSSTPAANEAQFEVRLNGLASPNSRLQVGVRWPDGTFTIGFESEAS